MECSTHIIDMLDLRRVLHTDHRWSESHNRPILLMQCNVFGMRLVSKNPGSPWNIGPGSQPWAGYVAECEIRPQCVPQPQKEATDEQATDQS
jgi:hypothetical protein